jgi:hypothetical protein
MSNKSLDQLLQTAHDSATGNVRNWLARMLEGDTLSRGEAGPLCPNEGRPEWFATTMIPAAPARGKRSKAVSK